MEELPTNIKFCADDLVDCDESQSSKSTKHDLFLESITQNTFHVEHCISNCESYAVLESRDVTKMCNNASGLQFMCDGLINRLNLIDFPISQYTLSFNGQNVSTATINSSGLSFDIAKNLKRTNSMMEILGAVLYSKDEPNISNRNEYFNMSRLDRIKINTCNNLTFELNEKLQIEAIGYFYENGNWSDLKSKIINVYPNPKNNMTLNLNHPTDSLDLHVKGRGTITFFINGEEYKQITIDKTNEFFPFHRIKLNDPDLIYIGKQNEHLSDEINKNTLNLSRIDGVTLVVIECEVTRIHQHFFNIYSYPERIQMFSH